MGTNTTFSCPNDSRLLYRRRIFRAMVYIAESSPDKKRGILGSGLEIGTLSGYIAASVIVTILTLLLTDEQMLSWGWRIPFLIAAPIGLVGLYLRRHLDESPIFEEMEKAQEES